MLGLPQVEDQRLARFGPTDSSAGITAAPKHRSPVHHYSLRYSETISSFSLAISA